MTVFRLPFPYIQGAPGSGLGDPEQFADAIQSNLDAIAIAVGGLSQSSGVRKHSGPAGDITTSSSTFAVMTGSPTFTIPVAGTYAVSVSLTIIGTVGNIQNAQVYVNGVASVVAISANDSSAIRYAEDDLALAAGDVLTVWVRNANSVSTRFVNATLRAHLTA